jgi:hypothetical protein
MIRQTINQLKHLDDPAPQLPQRAVGGPPQTADAGGG